MTLTKFNILVHMYTVICDDHYSYHEVMTMVLSYFLLTDIAHREVRTYS